LPDANQWPLHPVGDPETGKRRRSPLWSGLSGTALSVMVLALGAAATSVVGTADATAAGAASLATVCVPRPAPLPSDTELSGVSDAVHGRLHTYTVTSPAVGLTHVNVLLPAGYSRSSPRRYPVLYLLHGALSNYADWASTAVANGVPQGGAVQSVVGRLPVIVVMPDDSPEGAYSDWYGVSAHDAGMDPIPATPSWETYDINELIPWVDSNFHTQAGAAGRAIAGLSSGGAGAGKYAVAHPGLFGFVGMFSGALDTDLVDSSTNWYADANYLDGPGPPDQHCRYGDPLTADPANQAYYWHDNDPTYEAGNLKGMKLFVASGNGTPTTADGPGLSGIHRIRGERYESPLRRRRAVGRARGQSPDRLLRQRHPRLVLLAGRPGVVPSLAPTTTRQTPGPAILLLVPNGPGCFHGVGLVLPP
jgi:diacylglycerol O-acyltransferase/trehalose O-mycolyltransferase